MAEINDGMNKKPSFWSFLAGGLDKKSFLWGVLAGIVLTFAFLTVYGLVSQKSSDKIEYLEQPVSYENKEAATFRVFQVLGNAALAREESVYLGNTVVILGENFYTDQIVTIKNPQRVGTYSYENNGGRQMTVPVIKGKED